MDDSSAPPEKLHSYPLIPFPSPPLPSLTALQDPTMQPTPALDPTLNLVTLAPTSVTMPTISWPGTIGYLLICRKGGRQDGEGGGGIKEDRHQNLLICNKGEGEKGGRGEESPSGPGVLT